MSQYNKTVLTNAGLELAKRANAGQAKFEITRAVTSADDWSSKTIQDLEEVTAIPNIMQQGTVMDTEEVESNNSVIGVSLCFANKDLSTGYQIRIIGVYVKEEGQENDFLYAVTTAVTPEYMPDFNDKVLYRFNMQMYLVIGKAQAVNVVINDGASVTYGQFDKYKGEVTADLEKIENTHKEDMSHVVKSASINGGNEVLPDENGKIALVVPDPDLSKYVNIDDLKEMLSTKANASDVYTKSQIDSDFSARDTQINTKANTSDVYTKSDVDSALAADRGRLGKLEGIQTVDSPDFNTITATGVYYITNNTPANIKNNPASQWGVLVVSSGNGQRISQVYYPDDGSPQWCRLLNGSNWLPWYQLSTKKDVSDATNAANAASSKVDTALGNSYFKKQGINGNGDLVNIYAYSTKQSNGGYAFDTYTSDWTAYYLHDVMGQLPSKANSSDVSALQNTVNSIINQVKQIDGETAINDATDVNTLTGTPRQVTIYRLMNTSNTNTPPWLADKCGVMIVLNYDGNAKTQIWTPVGVNAFGTDGTFGWRYWEGNTPSAWNRFVSKSYVDGLNTALQNAVNNINSTRTPLVNGSGDDDLFAFKTNQIRLYPGNGKTCKNLPPASNTQWFTVQYVFEAPNNDGIAIFRSPANEVWTIGINGGVYGTGWVRLATSNDIDTRLPLAGGSMNSNAEISFNNDAVGKQGGLTWNGSTDSAKIYGDVTAQDNLDLAFDLGDDGSNHFSFRNQGVETAGITSDGKFTGRVDWDHVNDLTDPSITAGKIANHDTRLNTLEQNQFEVQTFTDATAAANWEAQKPGHRLAIIQS